MNVNSYVTGFNNYGHRLLSSLLPVEKDSLLRSVILFIKTIPVLPEGGV